MKVLLYLKKNLLQESYNVHLTRNCCYLLLDRLNSTVAYSNSTSSSSVNNYQSHVFIQVFSYVETDIPETS